MVRITNIIFSNNDPDDEDGGRFLDHVLQNPMTVTIFFAVFNLAKEDLRRGLG